MLFNSIKYMVAVAGQNKFVKRVIKEERGDGGVGFYITIAVSLIAASFILLPGIITLATSIVSSLQTWWASSIEPKIFPSSL